MITLIKNIKTVVLLLALQILLVTPTSAIAFRVHPHAHVNNGGDGYHSNITSQEITAPYKRPSNATNKMLRDSVQNKPCVDCGKISKRQVADHKKPLVEEYYETGTIDRQKMKTIDAVQPQCPTCSAKQGAKMSQYSKQKKHELNIK